MNLHPTGSLLSTRLPASESPCVILAVDDEAMILRSLWRELKRVPSIVLLTAGSAEEAMRRMEECASYGALPSIVLTDYRMQGMDGLRFLEWVGASYPEVVRMLWTADISASEVQRARALALCAAVLPKPWPSTGLLGLLCEACGVG
jgi:CheY-like chemotaxis protein